MQNGDKVNILLVDDRPDNLVTLESVLDDLGQNLVPVTSGREALKRLLDDEFAVILLDVQMPEMDGFETATLIRSRERTQHTPIIFLTAINKSDSHVARGYSVGAIDYVFKPYDPDALRAKVAAFVELWKKTRELQREIAQRRRAEEASERSKALLEIISRALVGFIAHGNPAVTFDQLLGRLVSLTQSEYGFIGELIETGSASAGASLSRGDLKILAISNLSEQKDALLTASEEPPDSAGPPSLAALLKSTGQPFIANVAEQAPRAGALPPGHPPLRSFIALPIYKADQLLGIVGLANRSGGYDDETAAHLQPFLNTSACIIDAYRNEQRRKQAEEEVRRLNEDLEGRVVARTAELEATNRDLEMEIAERKRVEEELYQAKETAEIASHAKSQFLANMSHELRTPLNAIIGFSELLEDQAFGPLNDRQQRYVGNILSSGRHLLQLINDILDLAKVEAGRMALDPAPFDVALALREAEGIVKALAEKKGICLELDLDPRLDTVTADPAKFRQIMYNLLSNAIKFTPNQGSVRVSARRLHAASPDEDGASGAGVGEWIEVAVADSGVGIRREDQERIFGEFEQVDPSYAREHQGTGLGLALTRRLVGMHGGRIWLESEGLGKGSTFTFVLPAVAAVARASERDGNTSASLVSGMAAGG
jgi:signal transduction histidine kinase/DNA-binding response OmpR family regulator